MIIRDRKAQMLRLECNNLIQYSTALIQAKSSGKKMFNRSACFWPKGYKRGSVGRATKMATT